MMRPRSSRWPMRPMRPTRPTRPKTLPWIATRSRQSGKARQAGPHMPLASCFSWPSPFYALPFRPIRLYASLAVSGGPIGRIEDSCIFYPEQVLDGAEGGDVLEPPPCRVVAIHAPTALVGNGARNHLVQLQIECLQNASSCRPRGMTNNSTCRYPLAVDAPPLDCDLGPDLTGSQERVPTACSRRLDNE